MKEKVMEALARQGCLLEEVDDIGYRFKFEGKLILYLPNEDDEDFLMFVMPWVMEYDENDPLSFYQKMDRVNADSKYVKAYKLWDDMALSCEHELMKTDNLDELIPRMIYNLDRCHLRLKMGMFDEENGTDEPDDADADADYDPDYDPDYDADVELVDTDDENADDGETNEDNDSSNNNKDDEK